MCILTPYPVANACSQVTNSGSEIICESLREGKQLMDKIIAETSTWSDLFVNARFFADLDDYIVISTTATTTSDKITWNKAVHSKVVKLASSVEIRDGTPRQNTANNILHGNYQ